MRPPWASGPSEQITHQGSRPMGMVHLVGAGPGDPMLLTRKAVYWLRRADVIAYDDLVHPSLLSLAKPGATLLPVGYRGLRDQALTQTVLAPELIEAARQGQTVVRLKAGDPYVLGRGGEEALLLKQLGIPFTVVPGITAALGAAAAAGIPLTHRGLAHGFRLITGHRLKDAPGGVLGTASDETLVVYMARKHLEGLLQDLIASGWDETTPAAFVINATSPAQKVLTSDLKHLAALVERDGDQGPGLVMIGPTVALHQELTARQRGLRLRGERILLARARPGPSAMAAALRQAGLDVIEAPHLDHRPLTDWSQADGILRQMGDWDLWVFGCETSVKAVFARWRALGVDLRDLPRRPVMTVGEGTRRSLRRQGWIADRAVRSGSAPDLAPWAAQIEGQKVLLWTHTGGRPQLTRELTALGAQVTVCPLYEIAALRSRIVAPPPRLVIVPSSSAAHGLFGTVDPTRVGDWGCDLRSLPIVTLGPQTAAVVRHYGPSRIHITAPDDPGAMVDLIERLLHGDEGCDQVRSPSTESRENRHGDTLCPML